MVAVVWWRIDIKGRNNIPSHGAFLLCPVHRSNIDGPLTAIFTGRRMKYLAKYELFKVAPLGWLFTAMGAISVNRGVPDRVSLKTCLEVLEEGHPLVLFPEGARRDGPVVERVQEGATYLALKAGVPVVPVGISGSEEANPRRTIFLRPVKLRVVIGEPIRLDVTGESVARSAVREGSELIRSRLQELFDEASKKSVA